MSGEVREVLMRELDLEESHVYVVDGLLALSDLWFFVHLDRPDLKDEPWTPVTPPSCMPRRDLPTCSRWSLEATCWCTTRTTPSPPRSRRSWSRPPATQHPRDQADALSNVRRQSDHPFARPGRGCRQAGGGARRTSRHGSTSRPTFITIGDLLRPFVLRLYSFSFVLLPEPDEEARQHGRGASHHGGSALGHARPGTR